MTVVDVADAVETRQVVPAIVDVPGPVYVRFKRGEIPVMFPDDHVLRLDRASVVVAGTDVALFASGMMLAAALAASRILGEHGVSVSVINVPVIKPGSASRCAGSGCGTRSRRDLSMPPYLFGRYGLSVGALVGMIWPALGRSGPAPDVPVVAAAGSGEYSPV
jgi:transketolase